MTDPFGIIKLSEKIISEAKYVRINPEKIRDILPLIRNLIDQNQLLTSSQFGLIDQSDDGVQLVFLEDVVNFCFWSDKGKPIWQVKDEAGKINNGWKALTICFRRALKSGLPILDIKYLQNSELSDWKQFFQGINTVEIPLLVERIINLKEAADILNRKYSGHFKNVIIAANFNAIKLVKIVASDFQSFSDPFLKRAQIVAYDISLMFNGKNWGKLKNLNHLTAFADYKLPQILRDWQVLEYVPLLAKKVDSYKKIISGSREETEIRAATILAVEMIKKVVIGATSAKIDNVLWFISQNKLNLKPYHRTRTIYY